MNCTFKYFQIHYIHYYSLYHVCYKEGRNVVLPHERFNNDYNSQRNRIKRLGSWGNLLKQNRNGENPTGDSKHPYSKTQFSLPGGQTAWVFLGCFIFNQLIFSKFLAFNYYKIVEKCESIHMCVVNYTCECLQTLYTLLFSVSCLL